MSYLFFGYGRSSEPTRQDSADRFRHIIPYVCARVKTYAHIKIFFIITEKANFLAISAIFIKKFANYMLFDRAKHNSAALRFVVAESFGKLALLLHERAGFRAFAYVYFVVALGFVQDHLRESDE